MVGVALTAETAVPGSATGANHPGDLADAVRFCIEAAKGIGADLLDLYDPYEFDHAVALYGPMTRLQTHGGE